MTVIHLRGWTMLNQETKKDMAQCGEPNTLYSDNRYSLVTCIPCLEKELVRTKGDSPGAQQRLDELKESTLVKV